MKFLDPESVIGVGADQAEKSIAEPLELQLHSQWRDSPFAHLYPDYSAPVSTPVPQAAEADHSGSIFIFQPESLKYLSLSEIPKNPARTAEQLIESLYDKEGPFYV